MGRIGASLAGAVALTIGILAFGSRPLTQNVQTAIRFSDEQRARILAHGPWPQDWRPDPSNRVSGQAAAIDLGRRLFFDAGLSPSGRFSCSSCHRPERGWTDGRPQGIGLQPGRRNTPSLFNVRLNRWFGWSGAGDSLWAQSLRPLLDASEMGSNAKHVRDHVAGSRELADAYRAVFARSASATEAEDVLVDTGKALAAYEETIVSGRTSFDAFRDALQAGNRTAVSGYPLTAQRGLRLFVGVAGCSGCHAGPAFSDGAFHALDGGDTDIGRPDGIARLLASPYNLRGRFNDDPARGVEWDAGQLKRLSEDTGFRTPPLRNLTSTAPYLHDGSAADLAEAIRRHGKLAFGLSQPEVADLVAFLETLSHTEPAGAR
jgi:cytochrome c peroxidase